MDCQDWWIEVHTIAIIGLEGNHWYWYCQHRHKFPAEADVENQMQLRGCCQTNALTHLIGCKILRWSGPISVALFVPDVEFSIAETFIEYLRNCYPAVKKQVVPMMWQWKWSWEGWYDDRNYVDCNIYKISPTPPAVNLTFSKSQGMCWRQYFI